MCQPTQSTVCVGVAVWASGLREYDPAWLQHSHTDEEQAWDQII